MDKRTLRSKKGKPRSARPYDRQNQGILGKVASKVKGLLNPSWLFNVSQWISTPGEEKEEPGCSTDCIDEDDQRDDDFLPQPSIRSKRPRLTLHDHSPPILSASTQTWLEPPSSQNFYSTDSNIPATVSHPPLIVNQDSSIAMNGDDHSENSEGSASTSGCSSLVSSRKERSSCLPSSDIQLGEHIFGSYEGEIKSPMGLKNKRDVGSQKGGLFADFSGNRTSLWSSPYRVSERLQRRAPSVANSSQPSFNLSTFVGPSKFSQLTERKVASPFYEGKTTFGGASAARRMPVSVSPYQVEKSSIQTLKLKNQVKVREDHSEEGFEGMSSAAKRILLTLEKMSSPVTDAKKIPNTNTSPVDLSLYMTPPKHRRNSVFIPCVASRGPPIANISTITKLTSLRNYDFKMNKKMTNPSMEKPDISVEQKSSLDNGKLQHSLLDTSPLKSGGGKMRTKLNQQHQSSKEPELPPMSALPTVPLPISKLPTFTFGSKSIQNSVDVSQNDRSFTFSNPIEHILPAITTAMTPSTVISSSDYDAKPFKNLDQSSEGFIFSKPIEHILPTSNVTTKESFLSPKSSLVSEINAAPSTWECSTCWIRNPAKELKCLACEAAKPGSKNSSDLQNSSDLAFNSSTHVFGKGATSTSSPPAVRYNLKFGTASNGASSVFLTPMKDNATEGSKSSIIPAVMYSPHTASFGGVKLNSPNLSKDGITEPKKTESNMNEIKALPHSEPSNSSVKISFTTNDSLSKSSVLPNTLSTNGKVEGMSVLNDKSTEFVSLSASKSNQVAENFDKGKSFSFQLSNSASETVPKSPVSKVTGVSSGQWECDTCWVRNPADKLKCIACETLRPVIGGTSSGQKNRESFKLSCPQNSSPITFKFIPDPSTPQTTTTTTTTSTVTGFKFGVPSSTLSSTFFSATSSTTGNVKIPEVTLTVPNSIGPPKLISSLFGSDSTKSFGELKSNSFTESNISGNSNNENQTQKLDINCETAKVTTESNSNVINKNENSLVVSEAVTVNKPLSTAVASEATLHISTDRNTDEAVISSVAASTTNVSSKSNVCVSTSSTDNFTFSQPLQDSKNAGYFSFGSSGDKANSAFNFKIPSTVPSFGGFPISASNKEETNKSSIISVSDKTSQPSSVSKDIENAGDKSTANFQLPSQASSTSTGFPLPTSVSSVFKFGDKIEPPKTTSDTSSFVPSSFPITTSTATTIPSFNFNNTSSSTFSVISNPKTSETTATTGQFQQCVTKSQDVQVTTAAHFSSPATTNTFAFGMAPAVSTSSGSSGFSFFSSTVASTSVPNTTSVFTFGASSNTTNQPKPGGFTFKRLGEDKQNSLPSNSVTFSTPSSTPSLFKFGTSVPTSGGFVFGTPKTEAQSVGNTPFVFGSGSAPTANPSTFSAFQTQAVNPPFQFGSQPSGSPAPAGSFAASNNSFGFTNKNDNTNQIPNTASQSSVPAFGCSPMQPVFGSQNVPTFGRPERPSSSGFHFGVPAANTPVFRFGTDKAQTTSSGGFSFGTPQQAETPNQFQPGFNMNTPSTFNFGAASSAPSGHFQFTASGDSTAGPQATAPRKYRKAVRRVLRKNE